MVKYISGQLDVTFAALADPTRRAIVERLAEGRATVKELARPFRISLPAISKHLKILEQAGLLKRTKEGRTHHCQLNVHPLEEAGQWMTEYRDFWESRFHALEVYLDSSRPPSSSNKEKLL